MRKLVAVWIAVFMAVAVAAATASAFRTRSAQAPRGTLVVQTRISFGCPGPARVGGPVCNPWRPYAHARFTLVRLTANGTPIPASHRLLASGEEAGITLTLAPGRYLVTPLRARHALVRAPVQTRVLAGEVTRITLRYLGSPQMV